MKSCFFVYILTWLLRLIFRRQMNWNKIIMPSMVHRHSGQKQSWLQLSRPNHVAWFHSQMLLLACFVLGLGFSFSSQQRLRRRHLVDSMPIATCLLVMQMCSMIRTRKHQGKSSWMTWPCTSFCLGSVVLRFRFCF